MINKSDLEIKEIRTSFGDAELPHGFGFSDIETFGTTWAVWLGNYRLAMIWKLKSGEFIVSGIDDRKFKSIDHVVKGLFRRFKKKTVRWE